MGVRRRYGKKDTDIMDKDIEKVRSRAKRRYFDHFSIAKVTVSNTDYYYADTLTTTEDNAIEKWKNVAGHGERTKWILL